MSRHTITIADLDDFEAGHIADILSMYENQMLCKKLDATVEDYKDDGRRAEWFDEHLEWHKSIMKKIKWTKETE